MFQIDEEKKEKILKYLKYMPFALIGILIIILIASSIIADIHNMTYWEAFKGCFTSMGTWRFWIPIIVGSILIYSIFFSMPRMWRNYKKNRERRQY